MKALSVLFSLTLALGAVGCGDSGDGGDGGDGGDHTAHWGYSGEEGPSHWGDLSTDWATCKTGTEQSPIDIPAGTHAGMADGLSMAYDESAVTILNNGHTVQVNYDAGSDLTYGGKTYELKQFHFHAHSENTVEGMSYPMEMHLVHAAADGSLAVVGVFIDEGAENAALADVFANMPADESEATAIAGAAVNATDLLPADKASWRFDGSLTTPPCSEGVKWILMATPIEASAAQIEAFTDIDDHNYRPTQDLNGRTIEGL